MTINRQLQILKALADPVRLRILHLLAGRGPEVCVCDLVEILQMPQSTVSRQIAPLRMLGIVKARRAGTWMLYSLADAAGPFDRAIRACLGCCAEKGDELEADIARFDALKRKRMLACCGQAAEAAAAGAKRA